MPDPGRLYVCATPIGNLGDVSDRLRAALLVDVRHDHAPVLGREAEGRRAPDAVPTAGHDRDAAVESIRHAAGLEDCPRHGQSDTRRTWAGSTDGSSS